MFATASMPALTVGGIALAIGVLQWIFDRAPRARNFFYAVAAFFAVAAIPQWRDTLAHYTRTQGDLTVLLIAAAVLLFAFYLEVVRPTKSRKGFKFRGKVYGAAKGGNHHHDLRTPVTSLAFGTVAAMIIMNAHALMTQAPKIIAGASQAVAQGASQVNSGRAAAAVSDAQAHGTALTAGIVVVALVVVKIVVRKRQRKGSTYSGGGGGGQRALPSSSGGGGGRKAIG